MSDDQQSRFPIPGDSGSDSESTLESSFKTSAESVVRIGGTELREQILFLHLDQKVDDHHRLTVHVQLIPSDASDVLPDPGNFTSFLGQTLSLSISVSESLGGSSLGELAFTGVVTQVQIRSTIGGMAVVEIIASSPTILMDGARHNKIVAEESLSSVLSSLLSSYPISKGTVDVDGRDSAAGQVQYRETDYAFLMRLASSYGYFARYDGTAFKVSRASAGDVSRLTWRDSLGGFSLGLGAKQFDFETKSFSLLDTEITESTNRGRSLDVSLSQFSQTSVDAAKDMFSRASFFQINPPADGRSMDNALKVARHQSLGQMITGYGVAINPTIKPGESIQIAGMGEFDGQYYVTAVNHRVDGGGYNNSFECIPLDVAHPRAFSKRLVGSHIQTALVANNQDPENLGRIKVNFPWASDADSVWARIATADAGEQRGFYTIPDVGDEVLVAFERGDTTQPVIIGSLWNNSAKPHSEAPDPDNMVKMWVTRSGNMFFMSDIEGEQEIRLLTGDKKNSIMLKAKGPEIVIQSDGGDITLKGKNIKFETDEKVELKAGSELKVSSGTNMKIEAGANLELKASANVKLQGSGQVEVKGAMIKLN